MTALPKRLQIPAAMIEKIFRLPFTSPCTEAEVRDFCSRYLLLPAQSWLHPEALSMILEKSDKTRVHHLEDALHVHILLFYADNQPILAGPYLSERMDASLCSRIGRKFSLSSDQQYDLLIGYGSLPVLPSSQANTVFQSVLEAANLDFLQYNSSLPDSDIQQDTEVTYHLNEVSNKNLELHYATEHDFMNAIRAGDFPKAMKYQKEMASHASGLYLNNFKKDLPASKGGAASLRTMARIAAYDAGVPAHIIHKITFMAFQEIELASSESQVHSITENMIQALCNVVVQSKKKNYSVLVQSILYHFTQFYGSSISIAGLANELQVSESYMIKQFRGETGQTPAACLRDIRLKHAASMLLTTTDSIQQISAAVGITDTNYFTKLFRKKYGLTPREYRRQPRM